MRLRLMLAFLLLGCVVQAQAAIARVAYAQASAASSTPATTAAIDTTGAALLIVALGNTNALSGTEVVDSKGNTWHYTTSYYYAGGPYSAIYYAYDHGGSPLSVGSGHTVTVTGWNPAFSFVAYSGTLGSGNPFDQYNGANNNNDALVVGSITPSVNGSLVFVTWGTLYGSNYASSITGSLSLVDSINGSQGWEGFAELVQTTAAAVNPTISWAGWGSHAAMIASFKPAVAASPRRKNVVVLQ